MPGLPGGAPLSVVDAAQGKPIDDAGEKGALDWLLGDNAPIPYTVDVKVDTDAGRKPLRFHMLQVDQSVLDEIDKRNRVGDGPFATLNVLTFNAEAIATACQQLEDLVTGVKMPLTDPRFLGGIPSPAIALEKRFGKQGGLLRGIVDEIREMAGNGEGRVGTAQRVLVDAAGNS